MKFLAILSCACALAGCYTTLERAAPQRVAVAPGVTVDTVPLAEALLAHVRGTHVQAVNAAWNGRAFTGEIVLKGDGETLTAVVLAPQMRLATLTLRRPHALAFDRARVLPETFAPEYALADFAFVNLPAPALAAALGPTFRVQEGSRMRVVSRGRAVVCTLTREADGARTFANPSRHYVCHIRELTPDGVK